MGVVFQIHTACGKVILYVTCFFHMGDSTKTIPANQKL